MYETEEEALKKAECYDVQESTKSEYKKCPLLQTWCAGNKCISWQPPVVRSSTKADITKYYFDEPGCKNPMITGKFSVDVNRI